MKKIYTIFTAIVLAASILPAGQNNTPAVNLSAIKYRLVYETFDNGSFDICVINADGTGKKKLTNTKGVHEMHPKVSPDGKMISYLQDTGEGRDRKRDVYVMNIDGSGKRLISKDSREQCWSPDGKFIAFVKSESTRRFSLDSWSTKGLFIYNMETGQVREHANKTLEHLYSLSWSPDGKYITATVLGGMGLKHTNIGIEVNSSRYFKLNVTGCRPEFSPDGSRIGWGRTDYEFNIAKINMNRSVPVLDKDKINFLQVQKGYEVYHLDWSPDGKYIAFSFGPDGEQHVGGTAKGWNICIAEIATGKSAYVTTDGNQNKEPDWIPAGE
jgi:Tol biopolymer transport system component